MFLTRSEYDRGVNTFSPEGRLFQVEYALEAIKLGSTTVGIATREGAVLGVEKRVQSSLLESSSIEKIMEIDSHLGAAMSGLTADARTMIDHARVTSQNHRFVYDEEIKVESVAQAVCDLALRFGENTEDDDALMSRPFGVALLIIGIDENGPQHSTQIRPAHTCATTPRLLEVARRVRKANCRKNMPKTCPCAMHPYSRCAC